MTNVFDNILRPWAGAAYETPSPVMVPVARFEVQLADPMNRHEWNDAVVPDDVLIRAACLVLATHGDELERICVRMMEGRTP